MPTPGAVRLTPTDFEDESILAVLISRLRERNRRSPARALSLAITKCEEALLWLRTLKEPLP
jgi:hypothetical protein